jgi:hypothetical protein
MPRAKKTKVTEAKIEKLLKRTPSPKADQPKKIFSAKLIVSLMAVVVIGGSIFFGGYFYWQYQKVIKSQPASVVSPQSEKKTLTDKLGKFLALPSDEEPTIAEVKDVEKLKEQLFFSSAQNGDKVLIYAKNKRAVLYRPETDKVIEITSLGEAKENEAIPSSGGVAGATDATSGEVVPAEKKDASKAENVAPVPAKKVFVYNGSKIKGLAAKLADEISAGVVGVEIADTSNAVGYYPATLVVDLSGENTELIQKIVALTNGTVGVLPVNEKKPDGDILVIGGEK